jgi:molybdate transport system substrate-binding protein
VKTFPHNSFGNNTRSGIWVRIVATALLLAGPGVCSQGVFAAEALVAVATNFSETAERLVADFEEMNDHSIKLATGSTGKLYAQIRNGAPYDAFLAADRDRPELLDASGYAAPGTVFTYAAGKLVLWSAVPLPLEDGGANYLRQAQFNNLAIANPKLAPYGAAAEEVLRALELWEVLQGNIVYAENVGQAYAMVATRNAEVGLIALSSVISPRNRQVGSRWDIPSTLHRPIRQGAVLLAHGSGNPAAVEFLAYLRSARGRRTIESLGYVVE